MSASLCSLNVAAENPPFTLPKYNAMPCGDDHASVPAEYIEIRCDSTYNHDGYAILKDIVYPWGALHVGAHDRNEVQ